MKNISYYNNSVVNGYYDIIFERKKGIQSAWHHIKFNYIKNKITKTNIHLDIGCGSGILSLAALLLHAKAVWAVDIDSLAVRASAANYESNKGLIGAFKVFEGSLDVLKTELKAQKVDLLVCNILAPVIEELAPNFADILTFHGRALLSGLLLDQIPRLVKVFELLGWKVKIIDNKGNWGLLELSRGQFSNY